MEADQASKNVDAVAEQIKGHMDENGNFKEEDEPTITEEAPKKQRPPSASTNADLKKKESQKPKFEKIKTKVDAKKDEAAA